MTAQPQSATPPERATPVAIPQDAPRLSRPSRPRLRFAFDAVLGLAVFFALTAATLGPSAAASLLGIENEASRHDRRIQPGTIVRIKLRKHLGARWHERQISNAGRCFFCAICTK